MLIDTLLHVLLLLLGFLLLLAIRKVTVVHRPTRQTSIGREHAEGCQWLQHLLDGCFDVFREVFADTACRELQDKVDAFLEDGGYAVHASFVVKSTGERPPHIVAVRASTTTTTSASSLAGGAPPSATAGPAGSAGGAGPLSPAAVHNNNGGSLGSSPDLGPQAAPSGNVPAPPISPALLHATLLSSISGGGNTAASLSPLCTTGPLELEVEVEYDGGLSLSLQADVPILRGRQLPLSVTISNVVMRAHCRLILRPCEGESNGQGSQASGSLGGTSTTNPPSLDASMMAHHPHSSAPPSSSSASASLADAGGAPPTPASTTPTSSSRQPPPGPASTDMGIDVFLQTVSEPAFQFTLDTCITKYGITNFFGFALMAKYALLRVVRTKLMKGIRVYVPLPSEWSRHHHHTAALRSRHQHQHQHQHKRGHTPPPPLPQGSLLGRSLEAAFNEKQ